LTVREVAELLRTTPAAIRQRVARGGVPGLVPGVKPMRFKRAVIREWLQLSTEQG
jgi:excisionase family DNA binding protein